VVVIGNGDSAVRIGPATHREVAGGIEDEIAVQYARRVDVALAVYRSVVGMGWSYLIE
jgi:hypothetical protein